MSMSGEDKGKQHGCAQKGKGTGHCALAGVFADHPHPGVLGPRRLQEPQTPS